MRNIEGGIATLISVALISLSGSEALGSQRTAWRGTSSVVQSGGQHTERRRAGMTGSGSRSKAIQDKMQHENQMKEPTSVETPNLRRKRRGTNAKRRSGTTGSVVNENLNQPGMLHGSANEVAVEGRKRSPSSTRRRSSFGLTESEGATLLRERGQPRKQPPTRRGPHKI